VSAHRPNRRSLHNDPTAHIAPAQSIESMACARMPVQLAPDPAAVPRTAPQHRRNDRPTDGSMAAVDMFGRLYRPICSTGYIGHGPLMRPVLSNVCPRQSRFGPHHLRAKWRTKRIKRTGKLMILNKSSLCLDKLWHRERRAGSAGEAPSGGPSGPALCARRCQLSEFCTK
jgi:hypothetical protein